MSGIVSASWNSTDERAAAFLASRGPAVVAALKFKMDSLMLRLQQWIMERHLSAPEGYSATMLHRRSGQLIRSIEKLPTVQGDEGTVSGFVKGAGGVAWYGKIHEFGGIAPYLITAINARALRFEINGEVIFRKSVMHPPAMARPFMSSSLQEMREAIIAELQTAGSTAFRGNA